jgi:hypothetical protein
MQFSPTSYHFISLRSKYCPQHPVLKHSQFITQAHEVTIVINISRLTHIKRLAKFLFRRVFQIWWYQYTELDPSACFDEWRTSALSDGGYEAWLWQLLKYFV